MSTIDLNADLGEGLGSDAALLDIVSSASIACGGHAGDAATMRATLELCKARGIRAGAHPGYADKPNFGRMRLDTPLQDLLAEVTSQIAALQTIASEIGMTIAYVKLHGALANVAAEDVALATAMFAAIAERNGPLPVLALDNSAQVVGAESAGLTIIREAYADRAYTPDGMLVPRSAAGAVIQDANLVVARCLRLAQSGEIVAIDGTVLQSQARSICLHGDTPGAVALAREISAALGRAGIGIAAH
ncbi:MAG: LamB/YcsF family protein [Devosia sp.]|nr:LamB/YcsF family protein [Devosia sp.]